MSHWEVLELLFDHLFQLLGEAQRWCSKVLTRVLNVFVQLNASLFSIRLQLNYTRHVKHSTYSTADKRINISDCFPQTARKCMYSENSQINDVQQRSKIRNVWPLWCHSYPKYDIIQNYSFQIMYRISTL